MHQQECAIPVDHARQKDAYRQTAYSDQSLPLDHFLINNHPAQPNLIHPRSNRNALWISKRSTSEEYKGAHDSQSILTVTMSLYVHMFACPVHENRPWWRVDGMTWSLAERATRSVTLVGRIHS